MATYDYYKEHQSPSNAPRFGTFWLYTKIDFSKQNCAQNDDLKIFQVRDKWLLLRGYTRCLTASTNAWDADIGTAAGGTELDENTGGDSAGDWTAMTTLAGGAEIALTADGYIYLRVTDAAASDGVFEVAIEVFAGPEDAEMDSLAE